MTACHLPPVASLPCLVPFCHLPSPALTSGPPTTSCSLLFSPFSTHHLLPYPSPPGPPPVSGLHSLAPVPIVTSCPCSSHPFFTHHLLPHLSPLVPIHRLLYPPIYPSYPSVISVLSHHLRPHGSPLSLPLPPVLSSVLLLPLPLLPPSVLPPDSVSTQCVLPFPPAPHPPNPPSLLLLPLPSCLCFTLATLKSH